MFFFLILICKLGVSNAQTKFMEIRQLIGKLIIQENISPIERNKIPNTFVINIPNPLASYYGRFTAIEKPHSIVFITKEPASFEKILRATTKINKETNFDIAGAKCEITIGKKKYSGIRVKRINRHNLIEEVQRLYQKEGFEFAKPVRMKNDTDALVRVNKFFTIKKVTDQIWQSNGNPNRYYIHIPKYIDWNEFRDVTFDIKNNVSVTGYDVAKGIFYENNGITEMVRIIKPDITEAMVKEIHQKYVDRLS